MAKSKINLPDGTDIEIEGSPEEIARILNLYAGEQGQTVPKGHVKGKATKKKGSGKEGPQTRIGYLIDDGYFSEKRELGDVRDELERRGWIYKPHHISTPLKRLVDQGRIRRVKEEGRWIYVNP